MPTTKTLAALIAVGLAAGACAPAGAPLTASHNPSLYSVHQPVVQRTDYVFDVRTSGDSVPPSEQARLDAWFSSIGLRYGDQVSIDDPSGYDGAGARRDIAAVAGGYGLLLTQGAPVTAGNVSPGMIRVVASRATASVPGCPVWADTEAAPVNNTSTNYGCATNSNIAAMVANPNDLVRGQDASVTANAATASRAIRSYRQVEPTGQQGLQQTSTTEDN